MEETLKKLSDGMGGLGVVLLVAVLGCAWVWWFIAIRNATRKD